MVCNSLVPWTITSYEQQPQPQPNHHDNNNDDNNHDIVAIDDNHQRKVNHAEAFPYELGRHAIYIISL